MRIWFWSESMTSAANLQPVLYPLGKRTQKDADIDFKLIYINLTNLL